MFWSEMIVDSLVLDYYSSIVIVGLGYGYGPTSWCLLWVCGIKSSLCCAQCI